MKLKYLVGLVSLQGIAALWTPMHTSFSIIDIPNVHLSVETDWHLGTKSQHVGKPSEYAELADEFQFSIDWKQWVKFNVNLFDT